MFVSVAFVLAERSLFLPSLGACLLLSEVLVLCTSALYGGTEACTADADVTTDTTGSSQEAPMQDISSSGGSESAPNTLRHRKPPPTTRSPVAQATIPADVATDSAPFNAPAKRMRALVSVMSILLAYYIGRTVLRNEEWLNEDVLLQSNLDLYPKHNPMSTYGLGYVILCVYCPCWACMASYLVRSARAMYAGDLPRAVDLLTRSIDAAGECVCPSPLVFTALILCLATGT